MTQTLTLAVCICDGVALSDFIPPMDILTTLNWADSPGSVPTDIASDVKYRVAIDYVAPAKEPVRGTDPVMVTVNPTTTYGEVMSKGIQYDILWIPAGPVDPAALQSGVSKEQIDFIRKQAPGAKYVVGVCAGSIQLATAGLLEGKRATTSKSIFKAVVSQTSDKIQWVAKARWVVDGNIWTSSGVSAGGDMALAFIEHLVGRKFAQRVRGIVEVPEVGGWDDDPFAAFHGLV